MNNTIELVSKDETNRANVIDDIIDDTIEINCKTAAIVFFFLR